jgi:hypothetical protein
MNPSEIAEMAESSRDQPSVANWRVARCSFWSRNNCHRYSQARRELRFVADDLSEIVSTESTT